MKNLLLLILVLFIFSCSQRENETFANNNTISVSGNVMDDYKKSPIRGLKIYVYKSASLLSNFEIMCETYTDSQGNYNMSFENKTLGDYYISFVDNGQYIWDSNNSEHHLTSKNNNINFIIRKSKIFKTRVIVKNNIYKKISIYNNIYKKTQSINALEKDTILYFNADPVSTNIFQMYVQEPDYLHYWYKHIVKEISANQNDTINITIDADLNTFTRYNYNENPKW